MSVATVVQLNGEQIAALPQRERIALINCLPGFKPAILVGTEDSAGNTNLTVISSVFHIGASPPLLGMILRPNPPGTERHTLENVLATGHYTLNAFRHEQATNAHQTAARYPREHSEFEACGFTPDYKQALQAPFVAESDLRIGCELREHQVLSVNQTHLLIGEIVHVELPDQALRPDGSIDLVSLGLAAVTGLDSYHAVNNGLRLSYPKADQKPEPI